MNVRLNETGVPAVVDAAGRAAADGVLTAPTPEETGSLYRASITDEVLGLLALYRQGSVIVTDSRVGTPVEE
ncbi:MAG: hypothetical protein JWN87_3386 [Frankiales bacterium]|nr:hypothetical protein [Frankiales bacterium]MCW2586404.1 hypothetical protein [Frankiales bacterium]